MVKGDSTFLQHISCPNCGSSDNRGVYDDGHEYCFGCGDYKGGDGTPPGPHRKGGRIAGLIEGVEFKDLPSRKLDEKTLRHFGYGIGTHKGRAVHVAPYYDRDGTAVAQKVRFPDKSFIVLGDIKDALPFGAHAFPKGGKMIVVTEGELDALSVSKIQGNKWPVVSIACGADKHEDAAGKPLPCNKIRKYFAQNADYFRGFEKVVLMFDMDGQGRASARAAAEVLGSRAHIAELPGGFKDPNEMLVAGKVEDLISAMWRAQQYRPEGLTLLTDLGELAKSRPQMGLSWPWEELTSLTYGIQQPYVYTIGAATGAGKTDFLHQLIKHLAVDHKEPVGAFLLEEEPVTTVMRVAAKQARRLLHTPDGWDPEAYEAALGVLGAGAPIHLYDSFGLNEWDPISQKIEFLAQAEGVRYFIVDHLTAFTAAADDERRELDRIMGEASSLITRLGITLFFVSHLATPEGKPHEEGGRVMIRHFKGSRAIAQWTHGGIALERNQQAEDPAIRNVTTVRMLKLRGFGWNVGKCCYLKFNEATGIMEQCEAPPEEGKAKSFGFREETTGQQEDF